MNRLSRLGRGPTRRIVLVAGVATAVLIGLTIPASAHQAQISGETSCSNGSHVVTWTIGDDYTTAMTIDSAKAVVGVTDYGISGYATTVAPNSTTSGTTTVPGNVTGTITLTVHATWPDGFKDTRSGSVELMPACVEDTTTSTSTSTTTTPVTQQGSTTTLAVTTTTSVLDTTTLATSTTTGATTTTTPVSGQGTPGPTSSTVPGAATTSLPRTGSGTGFAALFGLTLLGAGALLVMRHRRSWSS